MLGVPPELSAREAQGLSILTPNYAVTRLRSPMAALVGGAHELLKKGPSRQRQGRRFGSVRRGAGQAGSEEPAQPIDGR